MSDSLLDHFGTLPDPRVQGRTDYPLIEIIFLCISAIVSGFDGWEAIEDFGVGFYSFTIGILSSVLAYMDTKSIHLQKKKSIMNEFCNEMKINNTLKERMSKTLQYNSDKNSFLWANKTDIFNDLPIDLRYEIIMKMQDKVISDILFFKNCDDKFFVIQIVPLLKPIWIPEKENIWIAGSNPDASNYFIKFYVLIFKFIF